MTKNFDIEVFRGILHDFFKELAEWIYSLKH